MEWKSDLHENEESERPAAGASTSTSSGRSTLQGGRGRKKFLARLSLQVWSVTSCVRREYEPARQVSGPPRLHRGAATRGMMFRDAPLKHSILPSHPWRDAGNLKTHITKHLPRVAAPLCIPDRALPLKSRHDFLRKFGRSVADILVTFW